MTTTERQLADIQGWSLAPVYDTRGYCAEAITPAPTSPFKTPYEAWAFVWERAKVGDTLARRALSVVTSSELAGKSKTTTRKTK